MLKHILVPLDGSALAEEALGYAKNIVDPHGKITLVSAVDVPDLPLTGFYPIADPAVVSMRYDEEDTVKVNSIMEQGREYLRTLAQTLKEDTLLTVDTHVEVGEPASLIIRMAEELNIDVIVMSTHGRSGLSRWLFGSVTNRVLNHSPRPVLVIPNKKAHDQVEEMTAEMHYG